MWYYIPICVEFVDSKSCFLVLEIELNKVRNSLLNTKRSVGKIHIKYLVNTIKSRLGVQVLSSVINFFLIQMCNRIYRQCLHESHKVHCVKTKLIALNWQFVTYISWCQKKRGIHSALVKFSPYLVIAKKNRKKKRKNINFYKSG